MVDVFGKRAVIQALPRAQAAQRAGAAARTTAQRPSHDAAGLQQPRFSARQKQLENLARSLEVDHPGAASSLREGPTRR